MQIFFYSFLLFAHRIFRLSIYALVTMWLEIIRYQYQILDWVISQVAKIQVTFQKLVCMHEHKRLPSSKILGNGMGLWMGLNPIEMSLKTVWWWSHLFFKCIFIRRSILILLFLGLSIQMPPNVVLLLQFAL